MAQLRTALITRLMIPCQRIASSDASGAIPRVAVHRAFNHFFGYATANIPLARMKSSINMLTTNIITFFICRIRSQPRRSPPASRPNFLRLPGKTGDSPHVSIESHACVRWNESTGGEGGIRTPGSALRHYDGLANRCFRPLSHLSARGT